MSVIKPFHTGYTQRWRYADGQHLKAICMASAFSVADAVAAIELGWRVFLVSEEAPEVPGFIECLNSTRGLTCAACKLCDGTVNGKTVHIWVKPHGGVHQKRRMLKVLEGDGKSGEDRLW